MKLFLQWTRRHPVKFVLLILSAAACGAALRWDVTWGLAFMALLYGAWAVTYILDTNNFLSLLVAGSLLGAQTARAQQFQPAAPFVIGGIIIIVGAGLGYVGCKAANRCKKIGANRDRQLTNESPFRVAGEVGEFGAAFFWSEPGYCAAERLLPVEPTVFTLNISVESVSNATVTATASTGFEFVQTWEEFSQECAQHGLSTKATPSGSESFERNRHPCDSELVPITMDWKTRTPTIGKGGVVVSVESSGDLKDWTPLVALNLEVGARLVLSDASTDRQFYRVTTSGRTSP